MTSSDQEQDVSRRTIVGGMATGLVAGMVTPAFAQQSGTTANAGLNDPVTKHPHPPSRSRRSRGPASRAA